VAGPLGDGGQSVADAELSVDLLQRSYPQVLSTWMSVGIYAALVGYGASALGVYLEHPAELLHRFDPWIVLCGLIALGLHRSGRARAAGLLLIGSIWIEQHFTLATMPQEVWASPAAVLPLEVLLAGLWLGARPARWLGAVTIISVPLTVVASGALGIGPGLSGVETAPLLVGMTLAIGVTLMLLSLVLQVLGKVLRVTVPRFGRYRLVRRVGSGGMAEIWKARVDGPAGFEKTVAIKRILPNFEEDQQFIEMFISEARLAACLVHPNIVQGHDFGVADQDGQKVHYITMEYVAGQNLSTLQWRLSEKGEALPLGVVLYICAESAKALAYAHSEVDTTGTPLGFVHRDISPHNLMITYRGDIKVADFGIAKAVTSALTRQTATGVFKGKIAYMSPEQAAYQPLDARSDLFSLGIVLFELVTGTRLFSGTIDEVFAQVRTFAPAGPERLPGVPQDVQDIICKALAVQREDRYQDGAELEADLNRAIAARGWAPARADLSAIMQAHFAHKIALEKEDSGLQQLQPSTPVSSAAKVARTGTGSTLIGSMPQQAQPFDGAIPVASSEGEPQPRHTMFTWNTAYAPPRTARWLALLGGGVTLLLIAGQQLTKPTTLPETSLVAPAHAAAARTAAPAEMPARVTMPESAAAPTTDMPMTGISTTDIPRMDAPPSVPAAPSPSRMAAKPPTRTIRQKGSVSATGKPWMAVYIDGELVTEERPLKRLPVTAGLHAFRFVNGHAGLDKIQTITIPANVEVVIAVDAMSGSIEVH